MCISLHLRFLCCFLFCFPLSDALLAQDSPRDIANAAYDTYVAWGRASNAGKVKNNVPVTGDLAISEEYWNSIIKQLKQKSVYIHSGNIVIALTINDSIEEGFYIKLPDSSAFPALGPPRPGWHFSESPFWSVLRYSRDRGNHANDGSK
jgi:hypothetical protein